MNKILIDSGEDWTFSKIEEVYEEIEKISNEMGYNIYPNQVEIVTAEQMIDAYASIGMPVMYNHWSFGKEFIKNYEAYKKGRRNLAYEMIINSNPCVSYLMEQNTMLMQTLVLAHAAIGHNHFFKNNYLFLEWTDASGILSYLDYAKKYIKACEEKYGVDTVEKILDAAHSLSNVSVFRHPRKEPLSLKKELERRIAREVLQEQSYNDLWNTIPKLMGQETKEDADLLNRKEQLHLPEENLLYFVETYSPSMKWWVREIIRIVRNIAQYFYPQSQDKVANEGCATWTHFNILHKMYDRGMITDGAMLEFLTSHSGVTFQPDFDSNWYNGINPYALGFNIMSDIVRICDEPTQEDRIWFPKIAGCKDSFNVLKDAWADYRDESLIQQYLSPTVMRKMKMFTLLSEQHRSEYEVKHIHNERGYREIRNSLAHEHLHETMTPQISIVDVNLKKDRELKLEFHSINRELMHYSDKMKTLGHLADLWGYPVTLKTMRDGTWVDTDTLSPKSSVYNTNECIIDDFYCG